VRTCSVIAATVGIPAGTDEPEPRSIAIRNVPSVRRYEGSDRPTARALL